MEGIDVRNGVGRGHVKNGEYLVEDRGHAKKGKYQGAGEVVYEMGVSRGRGGGV